MRQSLYSILDVFCFCLHRNVYPRFVIFNVTRPYRITGKFYKENTTGGLRENAIC